MHVTPWEKLIDSMSELEESIRKRGVRFHSVYEGLGVLQNDLLDFQGCVKELDNAYSELINENSIRDEEPDAWGTMLQLAGRVQSYGRISIQSLGDVIRDSQYLINLIDHAQHYEEPLIFPVAEEDM